MAKHILIIEDEESLSELISLRLEKEGFVVSSAATGKAGLMRLKDHKPDLLILDLMLPDISGEDICRGIRRDSEFAGLPVIMLTAKAQDIDIAMGKVVGADAYIVKPFESEHLLGEIKRLLKVS